MPEYLNGEEFTERLTAARERAGLNKKQLAEATGATHTAVCEWEKGKYYPGIYYLCAICTVLNVSADWLLGLGGEHGKEA